MSIGSLRFAIAIRVEPDEGNFHAFCPALKGLHVDGDTEEEAIRNAEDAAVLYLKSVLSHREPLPEGVLVMNPRRRRRDA